MASDRILANFTITPATLRDAAAIARVHVDTWRTAYKGIVSQEYLDSLDYEARTTLWEKILARDDPRSHNFVAKDAANAIVGFSSGGENRDPSRPFDGEIYAIYLSKKYQGQGIGKRLFINTFEQLCRDGFTSAMLWVLEANPTRAFYEAMGGKVAGEQWDDIGGASLKEIAYGWSDILETLRRFNPSMRHPVIKHYRDIQDPDNAHYPGSDELLSIGSPFGRTFGFDRLGIHHEVLKPGRRTSWPHAEKTDEEFVYVIEGHPQAWIDGEVYPLAPGDGIGFVPGTGISHTFINDTNLDVRLLVVGDTNRKDNKCYYPLHPARNSEIGTFLWADISKRKLGTHDGIPSRQTNDSYTANIPLENGYQLTEIRRSDRGAYIEHFQDREIYERTLNIPFPYTEEDADRWYHFVAEQAQVNKCVTQYAIRDANDKLIGGIGFHGFAIGKSHKAEIGYWLAKPMRGKGVMTSAVKKLSSLAFKEFGLRRITAHIFDFNADSARVLEKNGYLLEGILKKHYLKDGRYYNGKLYALVKD